MKYRKLGRTELEVSPVALGSWVFGGEGWGDVDDAESEKVIKEAIDKGINFIDTAPIYGDGRAEKVIGKALGGRRDEIIIATKCGLEKKEKGIGANLSAKFIREEVERSLYRLNVDMIDLYQCHWPDPSTSLEETFDELKKIVSEGKVRYIGISNFSRDLLEKTAGMAPIQSDQVEYSIFSRGIEEDLVPFCGENDVSILSYGSLGGGILSGKYKEPPRFPKGDARSFFYKYYNEQFWEKARKAVTALEEISAKRAVPTSSVAINWVLRKKEVASCIVGCRTLKQLDDNIKAMDWELTDEEVSTV